MTTSPALIDWQNPLTDHPLWNGLLDGWMVVPGRKGWKTASWQSLRHRYAGTLTNMDPATDWVTDSPVGGYGSLDFDGIGKYVSVPQNVGFLGTLCFSFKMNSTAAGTLMGNINANTSKGFFRLVVNLHPGTGANVVGAFQFYIRDGANSNFLFGVTTNTGISDGKWHHLAVSWEKNTLAKSATLDGRSLSLYVYGSGTGTTPINWDYPASIGRLNHSESQHFLNGRVAECLIFNEIIDHRAIYEESRRGYPNLLRRLPTRRYFFPSAGGATITLASATQTDSANAVAIVNARTYTLGTASETETANAVTVQQAVAVSLGNAIETDVANAVSVVNPRTYQLGNATDSSAANALSVVNPRSYTLGNASESDAANAVTITNASTVSLGTASESCVANSLTVSNPRTYTLTTASDVSIGRAVTVVNPRSYSIGNAAESNTANALTVSLPGQTTAGYILVRNATLKTGKATATLRTGRATATLIS